MTNKNLVTVLENNSLTKAGMNTIIGKGIKFVEKELETNGELQKKVINEVVKKKIVDKVEKEFDISEVDLGMEKRSFIDFQRSETTGKNYRNWVDDFLNWCNEKRINPLRIKRENVESYFMKLSENNSPNSIRSKLLGISSFYRYLMCRHPETFLFNPFHNLPLPKKVTVRKEDVVTETDIKELKKEFKRIGREEMVFCLEMMVKYGFRVGSFEKMTVNKNGCFRIESKGSIIESGKNGWEKFTKGEVEKFNRLKIKGIKGTTITRIFDKYNKRLFRDGKVSCVFSPHDLRHYCITSLMKKCKNGEEILKVSKKYHKQFQTTVDYCWYK